MQENVCAGPIARHVQQAPLPRSADSAAVNAAVLDDWVSKKHLSGIVHNNTSGRSRYERSIRDVIMPNDRRHSLTAHLSLPRQLMHKSASLSSKTTSSLKKKKKAIGSIEHLACLIRIPI
jgi:hypothetical protein